MSYVARRLLQAVPVLLLASVPVFLIIHLAEGDPVLMLLGVEATSETIEAMRARLGLDRPLWQQYLDWLTGELRGDFGRSVMSSFTVEELLRQRLPATFALALVAIVFTVLMAFPLGIAAALRHGRLLDRLVTVLTSVAISVPHFWLGILLVLFFAVELGWFPAGGYAAPTDAPARFAELVPAGADTFHLHRRGADPFRAHLHGRGPPSGLHPHRAWQGAVAAHCDSAPRGPQRAGSRGHGAGGSVRQAARRHDHRRGGLRLAGARAADAGRDPQPRLSRSPGRVPGVRGPGHRLEPDHRYTLFRDRSDRSRVPADRHDFWGAGPGDTQEWYTLPENLYRAYLASGDACFREFADLWLYEDFWGPFANSVPETVLPVHAYSHVNSLSSAAMAYLVDGDRRYLQICVNAYDFLQRTQCYATGGYGPDERLMPPDGSLGRSLHRCAYHVEVPCCTFAAFKLIRYLMTLTGEARFGDWAEALLLNAIGTALATEPDGRTFYYGEYGTAVGIKRYYWHEWPCCSGTYLQNMAEYSNLAFFRDADGLYVNLYLPAETTWSQDGQQIMARQETDFPESEGSQLTLEMAAPAELALRFRVPGWSRGTTLALNGRHLQVAAVPGSWAIVRQTFAPDDRLTITHRMELRAVPVDPQHPFRAAIMYGPVVLAQDEACCRRPFALASYASLERRLVKDGPGVRFRIINAVPERHTRYLLPLYTFPAFWPYWVYFDFHAEPLY